MCGMRLPMYHLSLTRIALLANMILSSTEIGWAVQIKVLNNN